MALTSVCLADETPAKAVYAFDLWVDASDNLKRIRDREFLSRGLDKILSFPLIYVRKK